MIKYERGLSHSYVVFSDDEKKTDDLTINMLRENRIEGLLPVKVSINNSMAEVSYEISGYQTMEKMFTNKRITHEPIMLLLETLQSLSDNLEAYYLESECLVLDPGNIYWREDLTQVLFCYDPTGECAGEMRLVGLSDLILERADYSDYKSIVYAYEFHQAVKEENFSLGGVIEKLKGVGVPTFYSTTPEPSIVADNILEFTKKEEVSEAIVQKKEEEKPVEVVKEKVNPIVQEMAELLDEDDWENEEPSGKLFGFTKKKKPKKEKAKKKESVEETDFMEESFFHVGKVDSPGENKVFESKRYEISSVNSVSGNLIMENYPFLVGCLQYAVDGCLEDSSISRFHARFDQNMGKVYLSDLNSATGTFLNGERLKGSGQKEIKVGDKIRFGNLDFVVT